MDSESWFGVIPGIFCLVFCFLSVPQYKQLHPTKAFFIYRILTERRKKKAEEQETYTGLILTLVRCSFVLAEGKTRTI
jgi:hypothetical protein